MICPVCLVVRAMNYRWYQIACGESGAGSDLQDRAAILESLVRCIDWIVDRLCHDVGECPNADPRAPYAEPFSGDRYRPGWLYLARARGLPSEYSECSGIVLTGPMTEGIVYLFENPSIIRFCDRTSYERRANSKR